GSGGVGLPGGPGGVGFPGGSGFPGGLPGGFPGSGNGNGNGSGNNGGNGNGNGTGNNGGGNGNNGGSGNGNGSGNSVCGLTRNQVAALTPLLKKLGLAQTGNEVKKLVNNIVQSLGDLLSSEGITQLLGTVDKLIGGLGLAGLDLKPGVDEIVSVLRNQVPCLLNTLLAWITDDVAVTDARICQLFGLNAPIWRQTCGTTLSAAQSAKVLRDLMTAASRLLSPAESRRLPTKDMAAMWAAELPVLAAQLCDSKTCMGPRGNQRGDLVLERDEALHLLVHLLDLAYRNGDIGCRVAFSNVYDAAAILASAKARLSERDSVWTALLEFGGVLLSHRSQPDAGERELAMRFVLLATSVVHLAAPSAQVAVLALVYTLKTRHDCDINRLIGDLVAACVASSSQREFKVEAGHLLLALYGPDNCLPAHLTSGVYALQCDFSDSVRAVWIRVAACCVDSLALRSERHEFANLKGALRRDANPMHIDLDAGNKTYAISISDAMLVVKVVVDSANASGAMVADVGLSKTALDVMLTLSMALGHQKAVPTVGVFDAVDWVASSVAHRLRKLASPERQLVAAHLIDVIKMCLARQELNSNRPQSASANRGLYW
ncbi:hypothetical protein GGF38_002616, partial [Coemansia sp. RSA 25]